MPSMMEDLLKWQEDNRYKVGAAMGLSPEEVDQWIGAAEQASNFLPTGPLVGIGRGTLIRKLRQVFKDNPTALEGSTQTANLLTKKGLKNIRSVSRTNEPDTWGYATPLNLTKTQKNIAQVYRQIELDMRRLNKSAGEVLDIAYPERPDLKSLFLGPKGELRMPPTKGGPIALSPDARPTTFGHEVGHLIDVDTGGQVFNRKYEPNQYLMEKLGSLQGSHIYNRDEVVAETIGHVLSGGSRSQRVFNVYNKIGMQEDLNSILDMIIESKYVDFKR